MDSQHMQKVPTVNLFLILLVKGSFHSNSALIVDAAVRLAWKTYTYMVSTSMIHAKVIDRTLNLHSKHLCNLATWLMYDLHFHHKSHEYTSCEYVQYIIIHCTVLMTRYLCHILVTSQKPKHKFHIAGIFHKWKLSQISQFRGSSQKF